MTVHQITHLGQVEQAGEAAAFPERRHPKHPHSAVTPGKGLLSIPSKSQSGAERFILAQKDIEDQAEDVHS